MNKILLSLSLLFSTAAIADVAPAASPAASSCEAKAVDKNGKPLAGAAKTSFMKKCEKDAAAPAADPGCEAKAVDKNGKALAGAAKTSFMKKCEKDAAAAPTTTTTTKTTETKPAAK